jgi:hypothetical protein
MESELRSPMPRRRAHLHTLAKDPQVSKPNQQREEGMRARKSSGGHRSKPCNSRVRVRVSAERAREGTERGSRSETGSKTRGWRREWKARGRKGGRDTYLGGGGGRAPGAPLLPTLRRDGLLLRHHRQRREPTQYSTPAACSNARELFRWVVVRGSERPRRTRTGWRATGVEGQMMASGTEAPPTEPRATRPLSPPIVLCKQAPLSAGPSGQPLWVTKAHVHGTSEVRRAPAARHTRARTPPSSASGPPFPRVPATSLCGYAAACTEHREIEARAHAQPDAFARGGPL